MCVCVGGGLWITSDTVTLSDVSRTDGNWSLHFWTQVQIIFRKTWFHFSPPEWSPVKWRWLMCYQYVWHSQCVSYHYQSELQHKVNLFNRSQMIAPADLRRTSDPWIYPTVSASSMAESLPQSARLTSLRVYPSPPSSISESLPQSTVFHLWEFTPVHRLPLLRVYHIPPSSIVGGLRRTPVSARQLDGLMVPSIQYPRAEVV